MNQDGGKQKGQEQQRPHQHQRVEYSNYKVDGVALSKDDLNAAITAFQRFDKDNSGAIDTKVRSRHGRVSNLFYYPGFEPFDEQ